VVVVVKQMKEGEGSEVAEVGFCGPNKLDRLKAWGRSMLTMQSLIISGYVVALTVTSALNFVFIAQMAHALGYDRFL
jgi:hypothetical protein